MIIVSMKCDDVKFSRLKPPIYDKAVDIFDLPKDVWKKGIVFTYGNTIYSKDIPDGSTIVHESVHIKQQSIIGPEKWWNNYFWDEKFRLQQELEAYQEQYSYLKRTITDRENLFHHLNRIASDLSKMYGFDMSVGEARALIKGE